MNLENTISEMPCEMCKKPFKLSELRSSSAGRVLCRKCAPALFPALTKCKVCGTETDALIADPSAYICSACELTAEKERAKRREEANAKVQAIRKPLEWIEPAPVVKSLPEVVAPDEAVDDEPSLGDYLSFRKMLSTDVIKVLFWLGVIAVTIYAAVAVYAAFQIKSEPPFFTTLLAVGFWIGGVLGLRLICETAIVLFNIHDCLQEIRKKGLPNR